MSDTIEQQRHARQLAFIASGADLVVGNPADCPLPPAVLAATRGDEPHVVQTFDGGLTAVVHRLNLGGRDWTLKVARAEARVKNVDGQTSFLNEVQRRADFQRLKSVPGGRERWAGIVDTVYASLRAGVILSPWIEGEIVHAWDERKLAQVLAIATEAALEGLFEWDLSPGNILDDGQQLRLFDFGYMYPYDPLKQFNSAGHGTDVPLFHPAERFETRNYFGVLLRMEAQDSAAALRAFRLEKEVASDVYRRWRAALSRRGADAGVLGWIDAILARWQRALGGDLEALYLAEGWRSHLLDLDDDLRGQSCTPTTLARADWLLARLAHDFTALQRQGAFFWHDVGRSQAELLADYRARREQAERWQLR